MCKCFALRPDGTCGILLVSECHPENCSFYKTADENSASRTAAMDRLASMDCVEQEYMADKYFDGRMPWNESEGDKSCQ